MNVRRAAPLTAAAALAALLAGCTGAPGAGPSADERSPLEKVFEQLWGMDMSPEDQQQHWDEQNAKIEELVAQCMQKEGFEYSPNIGGGNVVIGSDDEWKPDDRDWVAQYGYGAVNWPGRDDQPDPGESYEDPNADYLAGLSESEQTAYYEVLYGAPTEDPNAEWTWEDGGCHGWAQNEAGTDPMADIWESEEVIALFGKLEGLHESVSEHEAFRKANEDWASCMADAGFSFTQQGDASNSIYDELNTYYENQTDWIENDPEIAKIGEKEIEVALADLDCVEKSDYRDRTRAVQWEFEEKFIAENKAEIDAVIALAKSR